MSDERVRQLLREIDRELEGTNKTLLDFIKVPLSAALYELRTRSTECTINFHRGETLFEFQGPEPVWVEATILRQAKLQQDRMRIECIDKTMELAGPLLLHRLVIGRTA